MENVAAVKLAAPAFQQPRHGTEMGMHGATQAASVRDCQQQGMFEPHDE